MSNELRVRFAPSPTGHLHVGNARTAMLNYLFALRNSATMILRIEDTDPERSKKEYEQGIIASLKWLGLRWQEGPEVGGAYGPYRQSERMEHYRDFLARLQALNAVYPCYCQEDELEAAREQKMASGEMVGYSGRCRNLTAADRAEFEAAGKKPAWRFKVNAPEVGFTDLIRGAVKFEGGQLGDFIIVRKNGLPAYNFAVVVDDTLMRISHVIRGEDHISNTPRQLLIYQALGLTPPQFAHHSLLLGADRTKLSKRHGVTSVAEFRRLGYLNAALANYLVLLGWEPPEAKEIFAPEEMAPYFDFLEIGKSGAIFDFEKLKWLNGQHLRRLPLNELAELMKPFALEAGLPIAEHSDQWLQEAAAAVRNGLVTLADTGRALAVFFEDHFELHPEAATLLKEAQPRQVTAEFYRLIKEKEDFSRAGLGAALKAAGQTLGLKGHDLYMPIRAAVTGQTAGPELDKVILLLGREACLKRMEKLGLDRN